MRLLGGFGRFVLWAGGGRFRRERGTSYSCGRRARRPRGNVGYFGYAAPGRPTTNIEPPGRRSRSQVCPKARGFWVCLISCSPRIPRLRVNQAKNPARNLQGVQKGRGRSRDGRSLLLLIGGSAAFEPSTHAAKGAG